MGNTPLATVSQRDRFTFAVERYWFESNKSLTRLEGEEEDSTRVESWGKSDLSAKGYVGAQWIQMDINQYC
jgi:hypothetical protein